MNHIHKYLEKINNFNDIYLIAEDLEKKEKGDLFELITYYLFKLDPRLNNQLQSIWLYNDIPDKIRNELNLPTRDKGIDLLPKIHDQYYPIQCKFRQNPQIVISWTELSTFFGLAFGMNHQINKGFFVTNTMDLCDEVIKSKKVEPIYADYFNGLPDNFFNNIRNDLNQKKIIRYQRKIPFQYQRICQVYCELNFAEFNRGYIEMACGTGKTLSSYWIDQKFKTMRTVIFVPSLYLLSQFYSDWVNQSCAEKHNFNYLLIGSDAAL